MSKFTPHEDEKIYKEGRGAYLKSSLNVIPGYGFLTSERLVFCGSNSPLSALSGSPYDQDIMFSIPVAEIAAVREAKHGLAKKILLSTRTGDQYTVQFDPHGAWFAVLQNPAGLLRAAPASLDESASKGDAKAWYYEENGQRVGPLTTAKMRQFVQSNHTIYRFTNVWADGMPEWKPAEETELGAYFEGPPPLIGDSVDNTVVWILAFAPILGVLLQNLLLAMVGADFSFSWILPVGLNIILSLFDEMRLNAAGHNTRALGLGSSVLVPVYLYKRAKVMKQNPAYLVIWIASFVVAFFL